MALIIVSYPVEMSSFTQAEEDALALTLAGTDAESSKIWNSERKRRRVWNGSAFEDIPDAPEIANIQAELKTVGITKYKELIYTGDNLTQLNIWEDSGMTTKIFQQDFTYVNNILTSLQVTRISDTFVYTKTFTYSGSGVLINIETN